MRNSHTFVLKALLDEQNAARVRGQISEPTATDEWRASFGDAHELLAQLLKRLTAAPAEAMEDIAEIGHARERVESN